MMTNTIRHRAGALALALAVAGLSGCDGLLVVENPAAIQDEDLNTQLLATTLANSVKGEVQTAFDNLAYFSAIITDEAVTGHNFETWKQVDLRDLTDDNGTMSGHYNQIHSARAFADTTASRLKTILPDGNADLRTAIALIFGGYSYVWAGEFLCESPLNVSAEMYTPDELTAMAVTRFTEGIQIAQAALAGGASATEANQLINLGRVGLGRAHLQLGADGAAASAVANVPDDFVWWVRYSINSGRESGLWQGATTGSNRNLGVDVTYRFLNDTRVVHTATSTRGHNNLTDLWTPYQSPSFGNWERGQQVGFTQETSMRLASGLEARYIAAEAGGATAATLTFVNERRAVGGQDPVDLSGAALMAELRDQRRRDFYLDGHRIGDLRRYEKRGVGDFWPSGQHPNAIWGNYQNGTCIPVPLAEKIGNPNLQG